MATALRVFQPIQQSVVTTPGSIDVGTRLAGGVFPRPTRVSGVEAALQRVTMCLLTEPGSVELDPGFGAGLRSAMLDIPGQELERAQMAAQQVIDKARDDLLGTGDEEVRLVDLRVLSVEHDADKMAWVLEVEAETTAGTQVVQL
jgi:hypothetical protein